MCKARVHTRRQRAADPTAPTPTAPPKAHARSGPGRCWDTPHVSAIAASTAPRGCNYVYAQVSACRHAPPKTHQPSSSPAWRHRRGKPHGTMPLRRMDFLEWLAFHVHRDTQLQASSRFSLDPQRRHANVHVPAWRLHRRPRFYSAVLHHQHPTRAPYHVYPCVALPSTSAAHRAHPTTQGGRQVPGYVAPTVFRALFCHVLHSPFCHTYHTSEERHVASHTCTCTS